MANFKPSFPYSTPALLLIPSYTSVKGVMVKAYPEDANAERINISFKTYGGTESTENGIYSVIDTANVETWFRPDIKADCRIKLLETNEVYEIIGKPENIEMRNQFLKFKVKAIETGA